jgi:hypothetical protein
MAVVVIQEFEASTDEYDKVEEVLDTNSNPPEGLIVHTGSVVGEGRMKVVDVWESAENFQSFVQDRLIPAIAQAVPDAPEAPDPEILEVYDLEKP